MFWILTVIVTMLTLVTLLPVWNHEAWWVRGHDFPRLQYAAVALLLLPVEWVTLDWSQPGPWFLLAMTFACLAYQAWWIFPNTPLHRKEVQTLRDPEPGTSLRIMNVNVLMPNRNAAGLLRIVEQAHPDVIIALETDRWWQDNLDVLEGDFPYTMKCPLDNLYGMLLYSRWKLEDGETQYLVEAGVPSMHALLVLPSGRRVRLHCVHPKPPAPTENPSSAPRDAELIAVARKVADAKDSRPVIVAGDLNDVAWSSTTRLFRKISGLLDPRVGRGMFNTFHASYPLVRWPLDHLFHSAHFAAVSLTRLPAFGSDHFPILVQLALIEKSGVAQEGLAPDKGDEQRATEKLRDENISKEDVHAPGG